MPFVSSLSILGLGFLNYSGVIAESPVIQCSLRSWPSVLVITDTTRPKNLGTIDGRYVGYAFSLSLSLSFFLCVRVFIDSEVHRDDNSRTSIWYRESGEYCFFEFTSDFNLSMSRERESNNFKAMKDLR